VIVEVFPKLINWANLTSALLEYKWKYKALFKLFTDSLSAAIHPEEISSFNTWVMVNVTELITIA